jgi:hypothetical protein
MKAMKSEDHLLFQEAVRGLLAGDFSRLAPLFDTTPDGCRCPIIEWYEAGLFAAEPKALEEAFTCACFNGRTAVVEYLLARGIDSSGGANTRMNAFHWAANRGQFNVVRLLIQSGSSLETRNMYGGTVLGTAVWSAINEPRANHLNIIEALIEAGAQLGEVKYPTGNDRVDDLLRRYGAAP